MKKIFLISISIILVASFVYFLNNLEKIEKVGASPGPEHNVWGWAWSENIGWISFNSTNTGAAVNYGVNIDDTGLFSGYAWAGGVAAGSASGTIGWISFSTSSLVGCPSGTCQAKLDLGTNQVSGWARVCSVFQSGCSGTTSTNTGDWDGWIRLRDTNYGVSLNPTTNPKEFEGWAAGWDDSTSTAVIGWISFNCKDRDWCATSSYKVVTSLNLPPTASNPTSTLYTCAWGMTPQAAPGLSVSLKWTYFDPEGKPQKSYEIWLASSTNATFSDPKFNHKVNSDSWEYALALSHDDNGDWISSLAWGETYIWKVRVWDSDDATSSWSDVATFTLPSHAYPYPDFIFSPLSGTVGQVINFNDNSTCYDDVSTGSPCGGNDSFFWGFQDGNPATSMVENPTTTFVSTGSKNVQLTVTDSTGFSCLTEKGFNVKARLPWWREILPF